MDEGHREWLRANGFERVGGFSRETKKFEPSATLKALPGIYAFVVDGTIFYIGKASKLADRIPRYNRSFSDAGVALRQSHVGIRDFFESGKTVEVWAVEFGERHSGLTLEQLESNWIKKHGPLWNGSGSSPFFLTQVLLDQVDAWITAQPEPRPSRAEAVRLLLAEALGKSAQAASIAEEPLNAINDD